MKRHDRPYGCTFLDCNKTFGSKNDWKRHENSQHFQLETWRCDEEKLQGGACARVYYRRETFRDHLVKEHKFKSANTKDKVDTCRIGRNCQARFWCGFCKKLVKLSARGTEAWTERFNHIDEHFMGRNGPAERIQDWVPVDSDKPKGDLQNSSSLPSSPAAERDEGSPKRNVPQRINEQGLDEAGGSLSPEALMASTGHADLSAGRNKRPADDDLADRPAKTPRSTAQYLEIFCCQCQTGPYHGKMVSACTECGHRWEDPQICNECHRSWKRATDQLDAPSF